MPKRRSPESKVQPGSPVELVNAMLSVIAAHPALIGEYQRAHFDLSAADPFNVRTDPGVKSGERNGADLFLRRIATDAYGVADTATTGNTHRKKWIAIRIADAIETQLVIADVGKLNRGLHWAHEHLLRLAGQNAIAWSDRPSVKLD